MSGWRLASPHVPLRYRNINRFPFQRLQLRVALGPTNLQLTISAGEPWPLRRRGFSPLFAVTTAGICNPVRSTEPHGSASSQTGRLPTSSMGLPSSSGVSAAGLAPSIFGASSLGGSAVTRCLEGGCF